jgi:hypothetical protein
MFRFKTRKRELDSQQFLARLANRRGLEKLRAVEERRGEARTDLCIGIWVIPLADGQPDIKKAFPAVTKDFTCRGIGFFIAHHPPAVAEQVLLAVPEETEERLLRVNLRSRKSLGAGWYLMGAEVIELLDKDEYPSLTLYFGSHPGQV